MQCACYSLSVHVLAPACKTEPLRERSCCSQRRSSQQKTSLRAWRSHQTLQTCCMGA